MISDTLLERIGYDILDQTSRRFRKARKEGSLEKGMSTDKTDDNSCSKSLFKANITLADVDRNVYDTLNLTLSQHPSESVER